MNLWIKWTGTIFVIGLAVRVVAALQVLQGELKTPETVLIAMSLADNGTFSDAFGPSTGPTAHTGPLYPFLLSLILRATGTGPNAEIAVAVFGCATSALAFALLPMFSVALGRGLRPGIWAGIAGALLPVNFWPQTSGVFEAPLTALALVAGSSFLAWIWREGTFTNRQAALLGAAFALASFVNSGLLAILAGFLLLTVWRQRVAFVALTTLVTVVVLSPWAVRNYFVLGSAIFTRSNLGLELHVSNNDLMGPDAELNVRNPDWRLIHPHKGPEQRRIRSGMGEIAYNREKEAEAWKWIASHPQRFLILTAERFRLFWFPAMARSLQTLFEALLTLLAMFGLTTLNWNRNGSGWVVAAVLAFFPLVHYVVQVNPRYRLPLEPLLFLLSALLILRLVSRFFPQRS